MSKTVKEVLSNPHATIAGPVPKLVDKLTPNLLQVLASNNSDTYLDHRLCCYVMLCYVMLCYVMLCYVMLCYVMLCYVMLCYIMLYIYFYFNIIFLVA